MISFKTFLLENDSDNKIDSAAAKRAARMIHDDCSHFLKEIDFKLNLDNDVSDVKDSIPRALWRGFDYSDKPFEKLSPRLDRRPLSSSLTLHNKLDDYFEKKFGWKHRSASLFCTNSCHQASIYGDLGLVFPIGKYEYVWSKNIRDAWSEFERPKIKLLKNMGLIILIKIK